MTRLPILLLLCTLSLTSRLSAGEPLKPFTSDGCSLFPDGTYAQQTLWMECCIRHDIAYWQGGSQAQRQAADEALEACVSRVGEPEVARLMLAGVRIGGSPYFPTWYRWGYGWPYQRGYAALTKEEKGQIKQQIQRLKLILQGLETSLESSPQ